MAFDWFYSNIGAPEKVSCNRVIRWILRCSAPFLADGVTAGAINITRRLPRPSGLPLFLPSSTTCAIIENMI